MDFIGGTVGGGGAGAVLLAECRLESRLPGGGLNGSKSGSYIKEFPAKLVAAPFLTSNGISNFEFLSVCDSP